MTSGEGLSPVAARERVRALPTAEVPPTARHTTPPATGPRRQLSTHDTTCGTERTGR
ncbi:hypothetical protein [Streptomyces sp. AF1A]|jgi:hypothetical protein|uniref:hypothetical protein n=1 Tax=Streptomyces sp. AF1A TaxID=3394350 RepID=UPI0039BD11F0